MAGRPRARACAFWAGATAVAVGVGLHLPDYFLAASTGFRLCGMGMDSAMLVGMALILAGTIAAAYGLLPPQAQPSLAVPTPLPGPEPATDPAADRLTAAHWGLVGTLSFALIIDVMKPATLGFVIPGMLAEYGLSRSAIAILPLVALIGTSLGSFLWGGIADRLGRRAAILLGAIMFVGTSICGAMPSFAGNVAMCFMMGIAAGGMLPITFTLMAEMVPARHRGWLLVLLGGLGTAGGYLAASGLASLLEPYFGWRIMWFLGLPTGLLLIVLNQFIPESPRFLLLHGREAEAWHILQRFNAMPLLRQWSAKRVAAATGDTAASGLFRAPFAATTMALNAAAMGWGLINFGLLLWLPADLRTAGFTVAGSDVLLAQSSLLALPTAAVIAAVYARWSTKWTLVTMLALSAMGLAGLWLMQAGSPALADKLLVFVTLLMIGSNGIIAVLLPYAAENYPLEIRGRGTGWVAGCSKIGGVAAQLASMSAVVPALGPAALILALPLLLAGGLVGRFGPETRGRTLDGAKRPPQIGLVRASG
ncbi:MAG: MFS transporter [Alphaproteobacteria bacterium]|nr:MFS transporter [Alphaproteobacteria bacterium]